MRGLLPAACVLLLTAQANPADPTALKGSVVADYSTLVYASYQDAVEQARSLADCVDGFLAAPSEDSLNQARRPWTEAPAPSRQTEAYRSSDGPTEAVEGLINSWPIDENLIDYVEGEPAAGVINHPDRYPQVTADLIASLNEKGGE